MNKSSMNESDRYDRQVEKLVNLYRTKYGDSDIHSYRVPARINLLGTHIDHRGGYVNYLIIDRELFCVAGKRNDFKVNFCNLDPQYNQGSFFIDGEMPDKNIGWIDFIRKVKIVPGEWSNYIKAAVLYISNRYPEKPLRGVNLAFYGNIPVSSGLSSSSAVVVAVMLAFCRANDINVPKDELAHMCGEAEWYVGTRGGSGDHVAMLMGKRHHVAHISFFPITAEYLPFPENYRIICCDSLVTAKKSANAKNIFNERIACYEIGLRLIKKNFPEIAPELSYIRDINPENLGSVKLIFEMLLSLPESINRSDIKKALPDENLDFIFESHSSPEEGYRLRDVVLYGISECERSRICSDYLKNGDMESFGELMFLSHDGDRVARYLPDGKKIAWKPVFDDRYIKALMKENGERLEKAGSPLSNLTGAYRCSTEELDFIVDTVKGVPGVKGAKLTGAGLGGTVLILVEKDSTDRTLELLSERYYRPRGLREAAFICESVRGAGEI